MENDMYNKYGELVNQYPLLTQEEEQRIGKILNKKLINTKKYKEARDKLILSNLRLALGLALEFYRRYEKQSHIKMSAMDFVEEANCGLIAAVDHYDYTKSRFTTYATTSIIHNLMRGVQQSRVIHIPIHHMAYLTQMETLKEQNNHINTLEIRDKLKVGWVLAERLQDSLKASRVYSIDAREENDDGELIKPTELLKTSCDYVTSDVMDNEIKSKVQRTFQKLSTKDQELLYCRFYTNKPISFKILSKKYNCSSQALNLALQRAMKRFQRHYERKKT